MRPSAPRRAEQLTLEEQVSLLSGDGFWKTKAIESADIEPATVSDGPHGLRAQEGAGDHLGIHESLPATCFPPAATLASGWDEDLVRQVGHAVGTEARILGVDVVLGPGLNIKRHPLGGRNFEYLSEDPLLSGRLAASIVDGIQGAGVGACLKHFAANNHESHRFVVDAIIDERTLREMYLSAFEHVVKTSNPWAVMASYNLVNGHPATQNRRLLTDILRDEWGFDGLVMSDWGAVGDRAAGVAAGMDLEMPSSHAFHDQEVIDAVIAGTLTTAAVTTSAQRVLDLVERSPRDPGGALPMDEHDQLARRVAAECTVLLTNDGTLPLDRAQSVALIGAFAVEPRYQGSGSSHVNPTRTTSAMQQMLDDGIYVTHAAGYDVAGAGIDDALIAEAVRAASDVDVAVVMVGLPPILESEGFDRSDMALPPQHNALVAAVAAANPRTVVALSNGAPVQMPWRKEVAAIVESYLGGQASGAALVDVLFGDVNPGGRLAETFPQHVEDVAADQNFPGNARQVQYRENLLVGHRWFSTADIDPAFAFGHGLSYTEFQWGDAAEATQLDNGDIVMTVEVTNIGDRAGSDVVQVYLRGDSTDVPRPFRSLAGYTKIHLAAGESQLVEVRVAARSLAIYDVKNATWTTPAGRYTLEVARSSVDVHDRLDVDVAGESFDSSGLPDLTDLGMGAFEQRLGHPLPDPVPVRPFTRASTLGEVSQTILGRTLKAILWRVSNIDDSADADPAALAMYERGLNELPLYAAANFSDGRLRPLLLDTLIAAMNADPAALLRRGLGVLTRRR